MNSKTTSLSIDESRFHVNNNGHYEATSHELKIGTPANPWPDALYVSKNGKDFAGGICQGSTDQNGIAFRYATGQLPEVIVWDADMLFTVA